MRYLLILILLGMAVTTMANDLVVTIGHSVVDDHLVIQPTVNSPKQETLRYELISAKQGRSGKSQTSQSGNVVTVAGQAQPLSTLKLGVNDSDQYTITLRVFAGSTLVGEDEIHYPQ